MAERQDERWPLPREELARLYQQGMTIGGIARYCGVSYATIRAAMRGLYPSRHAKARGNFPRNRCPACGAELETLRSAALRLGVKDVPFRQKLFRLVRRTPVPCTRIGNSLVAPPSWWTELKQASLNRQVDYDEVVARFRCVRNYAQVARELGISRATVVRALRAKGIWAPVYTPWAYYQEVARRALECVDLTESQESILRECLQAGSMVAVATRIGISRERVRQILRRAITKLMQKGL